MTDCTGFRLPRLLLPAPAIDLERWAVIACDQHTAEPGYWQQVREHVGDAPSTLQLIYPEAELDAPDAAQRVSRIQAAMDDMLARGLLREHAGAVHVERRVDGGTRHGLMLELDLEHYDFDAGSTSLIRPTEGTIVARLAPRMAVRRGAALELPHILVLIDDPEGRVIEPITAAREQLEPLYATGLMFGGGHVAGRAVPPALAARALEALAALAEPQAFAARHGVAPGTPPLLFAVGDGNHSLATAKAVWDENRQRLGPEHPSRWVLVEVENLHDPALHFEPIHRVLFGLTTDLRGALAAAFGRQLRVHELADAAALLAALRAAQPSAPQASNPGAARPPQRIGLVEPGALPALLEFDPPPAPLAVGTLQPFIDRLLERGAAAAVDYVHGDEVAERLACQSGHAGFLLPALGKHELFDRVVQAGPLPRKAFSMGEAHSKRYYVEARRIR